MNKYPYIVEHIYICQNCHHIRITMQKLPKEYVCICCGSESIVHEDSFPLTSNVPENWNRNWVFNEIVIPWYKKGFSWEAIENEISMQKVKYGWTKELMPYHISDDIRRFIESMFLRY